VNRTTLRRRIERLERGRGDVELTAEEANALAGGEPSYPHLNTAMLKAVNRYGLERLVLASFEA
jgi:hypothetical protein